MAGILAHRLVPARPEWWLIAAALLVGAAVLWRHGRKWHDTFASLALGMALVLVGIACAQRQAFFYPSNHIVSEAAPQPRVMELEMRLDDAPRVLEGANGPGFHSAPRQVMTATVLRIRRTSGWTDASGRIALRLDQPRADLRINQRIAALGTFERPAGATNPGQFDWADYYRRQRILGAFTIRRAANLRILDDPGPSAVDWLRQSARDTLARGFEPTRAIDHALLRALFLGDNDPQLRDVQDLFIRTGTSHHLAISGMHVAVLGGFLFLLCRLLCLSPRRTAWAVVLLVVLYGLVTLPSPPVVRSILLAVAFAIGVLLRRSTDAIQLLAVSVSAMLIYQPLDLYNAGFQLSFGTVMGLILFTRPLLSALDRRDPDEAVWPPPQRPAVAVIWRRARHALLETLAAALVAWMVSMPLIAWHFERLNPWAILASLLLAIPVFVALIGAVAKVALTLLVPWLAPFWASLAAIPVAAMRYMVDLLARLPGSDAPLPAPPWWLLIVYYLLLCAGLLPFPAMPRCTRVRRWLPVTAVLLLIVLPLTFGVTRDVSPAHGRLHVTVLSVGAGSCSVIELPNGQIILIDAGSNSSSQLWRSVLAPYLRHRGIRRIDTLYITHANTDHYNAVMDLAASMPLRRAVTTPQFFDHAADSYEARSMLDGLGRAGVPVTSVHAGQPLHASAGPSLDVLWPPVEQHLDANDSSLVMRLSWAGKTILFCGDIGTAQRWLVQSGCDLRADVLIAPHHGSAVPETASFLAAVHPGLIISSSDASLTRPQRAFDALCAGRTALRTSSSGAVTVTVGADGSMKVESFLGGN